jgi:extradiol dioxygenase family protein
MATQCFIALQCVSHGKMDRFYSDILDAQIGRSSMIWSDINLSDYQISFLSVSRLNCFKRLQKFLNLNIVDSYNHYNQLNPRANSTEMGLLKATDLLWLISEK